MSENLLNKATGQRLEAPTAAELDAIRRREFDGIMLGGSYMRVFDEYAQARRDICQLLLHIDQLQGKP